MKLVFTSYVKSPEYDQPQRWLKRIEGYIGILESLNNDHTVISIERINYQGEYSQNGVYYYFIPQKKKTNLFPFKQHRLVKALKPDVVFVNGLIFPLQVIQLRMKLGKSVKIIGLHHAEKPFTGLKKYLQQWADKCFDAYCFTSVEFGTTWISNGNLSDEKKVHEVMEVSSSFTPIERDLAKARSQAEGSPVYLWVGRLNANKDPLTVVSAFLQFSKLHPLAKLYMIFQTEELLSEIKKLFQQYPEEAKNIILAGRIAHEELAYWYNSVDFIISGSHYEGSGTAVCEAMSCGCVPVLTDIASFRMMTGRGKCGLLYEPADEAALLEVLQQSTQIDMRAERAKVLTQFREFLSYEAIGKKIQEIIISLYQKKP